MIYTCVWQVKVLKDTRPPVQKAVDIFLSRFFPLGYPNRLLFGFIWICYLHNKLLRCKLRFYGEELDNDVELALRSTASDFEFRTKNCSWLVGFRREIEMIYCLCVLQCGRGLSCLFPVSSCTAFCKCHSACTFHSGGIAVTIWLMPHFVGWENALFMV
jgi:hypothetical protein